MNINNGVAASPAAHPALRIQDPSEHSRAGAGGFSPGRHTRGPERARRHHGNRAGGAPVTGRVRRGRREARTSSSRPGVSPGWTPNTLSRPRTSSASSTPPHRCTPWSAMSSGPAGIPISQAGAAMAPAVAELSARFHAEPCCAASDGWTTASAPEPAGKPPGTSAVHAKLPAPGSAWWGRPEPGRRYIDACRALGAEVERL